MEVGPTPWRLGFRLFAGEDPKDFQNDTRKWNLRRFRIRIRGIAQDSDENRKLAERVGFEPTVEFPLHTLSKRAPSTTRTSLRVESTSYVRSPLIIAHAVRIQ